MSDEMLKTMFRNGWWMNRVVYLNLLFCHLCWNVIIPSQIPWQRGKPSQPQLAELLLFYFVFPFWQQPREGEAGCETVRKSWFFNPKVLLNCEGSCSGGWPIFKFLLFVNLSDERKTFKRTSAMKVPTRSQHFFPFVTPNRQTNVLFLKMF